MQTGIKNLGLKCKLDQNMASYLLKRLKRAILQILSGNWDYYVNKLYFGTISLIGPIVWDFTEDFPMFF